MPRRTTTTTTMTTKMTTCRLASQILGNKQRVCVFVGANNTQYREYLPYDAGECPRQYQCPYRPNKKPFDIAIDFSSSNSSGL